MCDTAPLTGSNVPWGILEENVRRNVPPEIRIHLIAKCDELRDACVANKLLPSDKIQDSLLRLEICLDQTWDALNTGYWKNVPITYRYSYTICSAFKCILLELECAAATKRRGDGEERAKFIEIIKQIDKAILLGAPLVNASNLMTEMASRLNDFVANPTSKDPERENKKITMDESEINRDLLATFVWIQRRKRPSLETFHREIFKPKTPAVLEGCLSHWKALESWKCIDYLTRIAGNRTVPIEIGSRYTEEDWSQSLVTLADFIQSHVAGSNDKIGYLAQHPLFDQIPELKDDFSIPDYCNLSDSDEEATVPEINAWFGPRGTLSPLHFDPKNNLLCQVFGWKRVILYRPEDTPNLYSFETRLLSNTAQVDPINPDYEKWPNLRKAKGSMCYLGPGDMLFIPPRWWHHVESLTPSFSISFWW